MNKLKGFILENKQLVMLTASVVIGIFLIFAVIAIIVNGGGKENGEGKPSGTLFASNGANGPKVTAEISSRTETESAALQKETTTKENETEPETVDPYTLPYKIRVNRAANCITVYEKDEDGEFTKPVKAITCSTGKNEGDTPLGDFNTLIHYNWLLMVDGSYGQYAYRFYGPILFHSVPYFSQSKDDLEWEQYNKLGEAASLGCVRVTVADAIWLIENCPVNTMVEVYDDADNPGPLGKPERIKIPEDSPYRGWDPTDPDEDNPWHTCMPEIKVKRTSVSLYVGASKQQLLKTLGAVGYDTCGNDVTDKIEVTGISLSKAGSCTSVKLNLTDAIERKAKEVTVSVTVLQRETGTTGGNAQTTPGSENQTTVPGGDNTTEPDPKEEDTTENNPDTTDTSDTPDTPDTKNPSDEETSPDNQGETDTTAPERTITEHGEEGGAD